MSERYAVIGHPVAHSKSPLIHTEFARATGQDIEYRRIEAALDGFRRAVDEFRAAGGKGLNVTLPFKHEAFQYCGQASERARTAEAVNTLVFQEPVFGDNTDGVGLVRDLERNLHFDLRSGRALVMGAGGAAHGSSARCAKRGWRSWSSSTAPWRRRRRSRLAFRAPAAAATRSWATNRSA